MAIFHSGPAEDSRVSGAPPLRATTPAQRGSVKVSRVEGVLCLDISDSTGVAVLSMSEDPTFSVTRLRELLGSPLFAGLHRRPDFSMLGRTWRSIYSVGRACWQGALR
jgi:hypothetical protein